MSSLRPRGGDSKLDQYSGHINAYDISFDDFQNEFDPRIFIGKLTSSIFMVGGDESSEFDARPYQVLFENAIDQLQAMRKQTNEDIRVLIRNTKAAEEEHKAQLKQLNTRFHSIRTKFQQLDQRISKVSHTAVRTGQQLENVDRNRRKTMEGKRIIRQFLNFYKGDEKNLDPLFRDPNRLAEAARMIQKLQTISRELKDHKTGKAHKLIRTTADRIEKALLKRFLNDMDEGRLDAMRKHAKTLCNFVSQNVVTRFVERVLKKMPDPQESLGGLKQVTSASFVAKIRQFYDKIFRHLRDAFKIIARVFPSPTAVYMVLLKRIFEQRITGFIKIGYRETRTDRDRLQVLQAAHIETERVLEQVASLKELRALQGGDAGPVRGVEDFKFEENMRGVFNPYRKSYGEIETKVLRESCREVLVPLVQLDQKQLAGLDDKSILFGRRKKGVKGSLALKKWVLDALQPQVVSEVLAATTRAVERATRLADDVPFVCDKFAKDTWSLIIQLYLKNVLSLAQQVLPDEDPKEEPDTFFFKVVAAVDVIARTMSQHYKAKISIHLEADLNMKSRGRSYNRESLRSVENILLSGLGRCVDAKLRYVERLLSKQRPSDFRPRDEAACFDSSEACFQVCQFVRGQLNTVVDALQGGNLDNYLTVFGHRLYDTILAHLKKFTVNPTGAMVVAADVKSYQDAVMGCQIEAVNDYFSQLREMASLLMIPVGQIAVLVKQRLAEVPVSEIHDFVRIRSDYAKQRVAILSALNM